MEKLLTVVTSKVSCFILILLFPLTACAISPDQYLFIELGKKVDKDFFYKDPEGGGGKIAIDYYGWYRFEHHRLTYDWDDHYEPFETAFNLNRLVAVIGYKRRHLYPAHEIPFATKLSRGVPAHEYVGGNETEPHLDTFRLLQIENSGAAEIEFAGQTFTLAIDESKEFTRKMAHLPKADNADEWYRERYANVAVAIYVIKDKITNHGFVKKEGFIHQVQPASDGRRLAYVSNRNGQGDIFLYDIATDTEKRITTTEAEPWLPMLSGNWLVWLDKRDRNLGEEHWRDIYAHDLTEGRTFLVAKVFEWIGRKQIVVDGDWLAYRTQHRMPQVSGRYEDYVPSMAYITLKNLRTGEGRNLTDSAHRDSPLFFKDSELIWEGDDRAIPGYYAYNPATKQQRQLSLELTEKERKAFREHGFPFLWKRQNTWCHTPIEQIAAVDGNRTLWFDYGGGDRFKLYFDNQNAKQWKQVASGEIKNTYTDKPQNLYL